MATRKEPNANSGVILIILGVALSIIFIVRITNVLVRSNYHFPENSIIFFIASICMIIAGFDDIKTANRRRDYLDLILKKGCHSVKEIAAQMQANNLFQAKKEVERLINKGYLSGYHLNPETLTIIKDHVSLDYIPDQNTVKVEILIQEDNSEKNKPRLVAWNCKGCGAPNQVLTEDGLAACEYCNTKYTVRLCNDQ